MSRYGYLEVFLESPLEFEITRVDSINFSGDFALRRSVLLQASSEANALVQVQMYTKSILLTHFCKMYTFRSCSDHVHITPPGTSLHVVMFNCKRAAKRKLLYKYTKSILLTHLCEAAVFNTSLGTWRILRH